MDKTNVLEIRSTRKGHMSSYFTILAKIISLILVDFLIQYFWGNTITNFYRSFLPYSSPDRVSMGVGEQLGGMFLILAYWGTFPLIAVYTIYFLNQLIYAPMKFYTFIKADGSESWNRLVIRSYSFPFAKHTETIVFDRATDVSVGQSSISRLVNAGSISITAITFTNADATSNVITLWAVDHPYQRRDEIVKDLPGHTGVLLQMTDRKKSA